MDGVGDIYQGITAQLSTPKVLLLVSILVVFGVRAFILTIIALVALFIFTRNGGGEGEKGGPGDTTVEGLEDIIKRYTQLNQTESSVPT
ncbi:CUN019 hypothetical protein [Culex nigripalpus nucleopolyhedrovirus]|uniref:Uncharacterized protein n=1 Tax=Culex nigripalpus nucleopolyhedrovirus (isolate Florida/1997) TaxID=645993 RepID=Q919Q0_NPVCO|nr:CUN019 hypothetical protein [Culex nigripalpus nucleopolyhedrovirus]AAK94097.1 CUN019 hypothetical protein [Culex nigripalpus nucleopolyhedrovirus]